MYFSVQLEHRPFLVSNSYLRQTLVSATLKDHDAIRRRRSYLRNVDKELQRDNCKTAMSLVKGLQGKPDGLRGFGAAKQVHRSIMSLDELNLSETETSYIQSVLNAIMDSIYSYIQIPESERESALKRKTSTDSETSDSHGEVCMCLQHEAAHFLVAYLLGVLPKDYRIYSYEHTKLRLGSVSFHGLEFLDKIRPERRRKNKVSGRKDEVNKRKISMKNLNRFLCITLGGLAAEHLVYGYANGFYDDIDWMEIVLKLLDFTEEETESHVRWASLNTLLILIRHQEARSKLAEAMECGKSIGLCIDTIENHLNDKEI